MHSEMPAKGLAEAGSSCGPEFFSSRPQVDGFDQVMPAASSRRVRPVISLNSKAISAALNSAVAFKEYCRTSCC